MKKSIVKYILLIINLSLIFFGIYSIYRENNFEVNSTPLIILLLLLISLAIENIFIKDRK